MEKTPKEMLKAYVDSQKINSTTEIMDAMKEMFRDVRQQVMESELDAELGYEKSQRTSETAVESKSRNYRNGYSKKTVKTQLGAVEVKVPRDRNGEYEPQIIGKSSRNADGREEKILGLYACGMSQRDISEQIKSLYDVDISPELVSKISEKIMPEVTAWQNRPLEAVYPFVFLDAIHYKVKENHQYQTKAAYVVLGVTIQPQNFLFHPVRIPAVLANDFRLKGSVPVPGDLDIHLSQLGLHRLPGVSVAVVGRCVGHLRSLAAFPSQLLVQLYLHGGLDYVPEHLFHGGHDLRRAGKMLAFDVLFH